MLKTRVKLSPDSKVVVLTGAGISAESGLKTFRDNNGLWENHRVEDVATPEAFDKDPAFVWKFYKERYYQLNNVKPNNGHLALQKLENYLGDNFTLITQNIDGLHTAAGNKNVIEMHGSLMSCFCTKCNTKYNMDTIDLNKKIPHCPKCNSHLRPDIVWFGEMPYFIEKIESKLNELDYFLVIGTSGIVYPAAQFLMIAKHQQAYTVGVNLAKPENSYYLDEFHLGKSGEILPELINIWFERK